jgi:tRNA threonylcarbamoyladenosine modification (KEOPS) complex  Pcc1 subunit
MLFEPEQAWLHEVLNFEREKPFKSQTSSVVYRSVAQTSSDFPDLRPKSIISINYEINQIILHI